VLSRRLASQRQFRVRLQIWLDEGPSWLVSLIVHLVAFLLVTSLAVPWTSAPRGGSGSIALTVGFSQRTQSSQGPQVTIAPPETKFQSSQAATAGSQQQTTDRDARAATKPQATAASQPTESAAPAAPRRAASSQPQRATASERSAFRVSPYAALLNRRPLSPGTAAAVPHLPTLQPISDAPTDPQQQAFDRIVDDFIAYDVGQLRGAAGMMARERFAALGPEALPALVRGLNRAAGMQASCPVGVIASKLISMLRNLDDPSLRQYAIDNIGAGVSPDAPMYHCLVSLRKNWLGAPSMPKNVTVLVERLEARQEGELMELMLALTDAPSDTIIAALRSGDEHLAAAATLAIIQGPHSWDQQQRGRLRAALMYLQDTVSQPQIRSLTAEAQRALSR
jgi:hypothetical protein